MPRKYYQGRSNNRNGRTKSSVTSFVGVGVVVSLLLAVFAYGVYWFRFVDHEKSPARESGMETMVEQTEDEAVVPDEVTPAKITLHDVRGGSASGTATRAIEEDKLVHTVTASLPEIDREAYFYEGWLVRRVPFDFFSTGEMVTNDLGEFVLEWEGEADADYHGYTEVVITLEPRDGDPAPADHVLEGTFRK